MTSNHATRPSFTTAVALGAAILIGLFGVAHGIGESPEVLKEARKIFNEIMSPYCPGKTLSNCTSSQAELLRARIREQLANGVDRSEIIAGLVEQYGDGILAAPPNKGFARLVWLMPGVALAIGLVIVVAYLRRRVGAGPGLDDAPSTT